MRAVPWLPDVSWISSRGFQGAIAVLQNVLSLFQATSGNATVLNEDKRRGPGIITHDILTVLS